MPTEPRWRPELINFLSFLNRNPELRFWQALLAWAREGYEWPLTADSTIPDYLLAGFETLDPQDTFYWEWPHVGPKPHHVD